LPEHARELAGLIDSILFCPLAAVTGYLYTAERGSNSTKQWRC